MNKFNYFHPIEVRYGDLDPQGHLNNAKYLTYMEQARIQYLKHLGLWKGGSFLDIGIILAELRITFLTAIEFGSMVEVGVRVTCLGNKSLEMEYLIIDKYDQREYAKGSSVQVAYDYRKRKSIVIPDHWRLVFQQFEQLDVVQNSEKIV